MKTKAILFGLSLFFSLTVSAQQAESLKVFDTRDKNEKPFNYGRIFRADFKRNEIINCPGGGYYSGLLSFTPIEGNWAGPSYQLSFSENGLFYRKGYSGQEWEKWDGLATRSKNVFTDNQFLSNVGDWTGLTPIGTYTPKLHFGATHDNGGTIYLSRYNVAPYKSELRVVLGDAHININDHKFVIGPDTYNGEQNIFTPKFVVTAGGRVGINVYNPQNALDVNGTIRAKEVKVESGWADFVFAKDYVLPTLDEVKAHIDEHKHLPGIPSEAEVQENGVGLSEITTKLLQKVEELTLYAIQQNETIEKLNKEVQKLKNSNE